MAVGCDAENEGPRQEERWSTRRAWLAEPMGRLVYLWQLDTCSMFFPIVARNTRIEATVYDHATT